MTIAVNPTAKTADKVPGPSPVPDDQSPSRRTMALLAGWSYVALFGLALFANFFVRERLVDATDAAATFTNLAENQGLVRAAIAAFVVVFALDVVVAWALYHLFRPAGAALSALAAWFRIVYTVFLGVAVVFLYLVLGLTGDAAHITAVDSTTLEANTMLALDAFNMTWLVGLVAFGIHLVLLGVMIVRSGMARRVLGGILIVAGLAYVFDTAAYTLYDGYTPRTRTSSRPSSPARPWWPRPRSHLWLLLRAGRGLSARSRLGAKTRR